MTNNKIIIVVFHCRNYFKIIRKMTLAIEIQGDFFNQNLRGIKSIFFFFMWLGGGGGGGCSYFFEIDENFVANVHYECHNNFQEGQYLFQ